MTSIDLVKPGTGGDDEDVGESIEIPHDRLDDYDGAPSTAIEVIGAPLATGDSLGDDDGRFRPFGRDLAARKSLLPVGMQTVAEAKQSALDVTGYVWHVSKYHGLRLPKYAVKAVGQEFRGAWWATCLYCKWLLDFETREVMKGAKDGRSKEDRDRYDSLKRLWTKTVHQRILITFGWGAAGVVATVLAAALAPSWAPAVVVLGVAGALLKLGEKDDKPLFDQAVDERGAPFKLNSKIIITALGALGNANINAALKADPKNGIGFPDVIRSDGPGARAIIDLPHGVTAAHIMEKRSELASGLRKPLGCVWPEAAPDIHAGRLELWVGKRPLSDMKQPEAPYAKHDWKGDAFGELPMGTDQRGKLISFTLMYGNLLIGSLPDGGKTSTVRGLLLALALDPLPQLRIAEHKGTGDLDMFEDFAHFYVSGVADEDIEATLFQLRQLIKEIERRGTQIKKIGKEGLAPDSKVTRHTASMRHLNLHPIIFVIDEAQEVFGHDEYGAEAGKLAERIIKRGRANGVILIIATQRPDKSSLPTGITANISHRFCLRVTDQVTNDMILGVSSYKQGIQATTLTPKDKGIGYLKGAFDDPVVVRSYYNNKPDAQKIATRAFQLRRQAGRITGQAAGEEFEKPPSFNLLDDLGTIFAKSERADRMHSETICEELRMLRPDAYADWTPVTLAAALPDGLSTTQVSIDGWNRRGLKRREVLAAIARRDIPELGPGTG